MECCIIHPALSPLMKHLVIGPCQKAPNFWAFHWSPHGSLVSIGRHFVTMRVVHLPKRTETSLITESDLITELDQAVRAMYGCNSWLNMDFKICHLKLFLRGQDFKSKRCLETFRQLFHHLLSTVKRDIKSHICCT